MALSLEDVVQQDPYTSRSKWETSTSYESPPTAYANPSGVALRMPDSLSSTKKCKSREKSQGCEYAEYASERKLARDEEDIESVLKWNSFIERTTFHGIRYIFDTNTPAVNFRRLLWLVCVTGAIVLFGTQVATRVSVYFQYKSNVDVQVKFTAEVEFPSVTLCNQNNFRMTKTDEVGLYHYIDAVFSSKSDMNNLTAYEDILSTIDADEFIRETAHQMLDFIISCTWNSQPCNISADFEEVITDIGVCFKFNGQEERGSRLTTQAGAKHGLRIVLNVEQYEYMRGPQNDAGVKILLQHRDEGSLIGDLGFSVAPGMHTLVGVKRTEEYTLESPYGTCKKDAQSMSQCQLHCLTNAVIDACNCQLSYMIDGTAPICGVATTYGCAQNQLENLTMKAEDCPLPCHRVLYEPILSYAQLSKFNIERLADSAKKPQLWEKFMLAREVSQRVVDTYVEENHRLMNEVKEGGQSLGEVLIESSVLFNNSSTLSVELQRADAISKGLNTLKADTLQIGMDMDIYHKVLPERLKEKVLLFFTFGTEQVQELALSLLVEDPRYFGTGAFLDNLLECNRSQAISERCSELISVMKRETGSISSFMGNMIHQNMAGFQDEYRSLIDEIFAKTSLNVSSYTAHITCLAELSYFESNTMPIINRILDLIKLFNAATETDEMLTHLLALNRTWFDTDSIHDSSLGIQQCNWPSDLSVFLSNTADGEEEKIKHESFLASFQAAAQKYSFLQASFDLACSHYTSLISHYRTELTQMLEIVQRYLDGNSTKESLSTDMLSSATKKILSDYVEQQNSFFSIAAEYTATMRDISDNIQVAFFELFSLKLPVLNSQSIRDLSMWQSLIMESNQAKMTQTVETFTNQPEDFLQLLNLLYGPFATFSSDVTAGLKSAEASLSEAVDLMNINLQQYKDANRVDEAFYMENFMQVDIFYKQLSYERVEQHVSFELLSLFGEVGGFLGLLLGASILTVCELIDFLVLRVCARCCHRQ